MRTIETLPEIEKADFALEISADNINDYVCGGGRGGTMCAVENRLQNTH